MVEDLEDPRRQEPPYVLGERDMLEAWLEFHRTTLVLKCEGIDAAARKRRPVPTSLLSLHGLVRHMAEVERNWFHRVLLEEPETPFLWADPGTDDATEPLAPGADPPATTGDGTQPTTGGETAPPTTDDEIAAPATQQDPAAPPPSGNTR